MHYLKKIIMHQCIAMPLSPSLHTNKTLVFPPSPYTLLLQSGRLYKSQVRHGAYVKVSHIANPSGWSWCTQKCPSVPHCQSFRLSGAAHFCLLWPWPCASIQNWRERLCKGRNFESQDLGDQHAVLK